MAKYVVKENEPYTQEKSTGGLIMDVPRRTQYSICDSTKGDFIIADIRDTVESPLDIAFLICKKLNN